MLIDAIGEQAALIVADIAGRRADQAAHGVALHVFAHVEAQQLDAHDVGERARHFGFADAGGAGEQIAADRLLRLAQAGARHLDGGGELIDGVVLAEHDALQIGLQRCQHLGVVLRDGFGRYARHARDHFLDLGDVDHLLALRSAASNIIEAPALVDHVDGFVRQLAVADVARAKAPPPP